MSEMADPRGRNAYGRTFRDADTLVAALLALGGDFYISVMNGETKSPLSDKDPIAAVLRNLQAYSREPSRKCVFDCETTDRWRWLLFLSSVCFIEIVEKTVEGLLSLQVMRFVDGRDDPRFHHLKSEGWEYFSWEGDSPLRQKDR